MGSRSNYHGETTVPVFSFQTKHEDVKKKRRTFLKDQQPSLLKRSFFKKMAKK